MKLFPRLARARADAEAHRRLSTAEVERATGHLRELRSAQSNLRFERIRRHEAESRCDELVAELAGLHGEVDRLMAGLCDIYGVRSAVEADAPGEARVCSVCPHSVVKHAAWGCEECRCTANPWLWRAAVTS